MEMLSAGLDVWALAGVLIIAALASYLHTVAGFGLGMIVIGAAGGLGLAPVTVLAAVVSLVTMVNSAVALPGGIAGLDKRRVGALALGIVPSIAAGVWLLSWLSESAETLLTLLLGALVLYGGLSVGMKPRPHAAVSAPWTFAVWGVFTGLLGGLFGMPGPPAIYHCYRQPLSLNTIRLMLILCFAITSTARTLYVGLQGGLTPEVWGLAVWAMPVVAVATWMGRRFPPPCSAPTMRRVAMLTLVFIGGGLLIDAAGSLI